MELIGKRAIITGASMGLGKVISEAFVKQGASVAICARDIEQILRCKFDLEMYRTCSDQKIYGAACDVSNQDDVNQFFLQVDESLGGVDILVNNAGIYGPMGPSEEVEADKWTAALMVNLIGTFLTCQEALKRFKKSGSGKIINLSGGGATAPLPYMSSYAASKAGVVRLTETLAEEMKDYSIDINAVAPGALNTRLLDEVLNAGPDQVGKEFYKKALVQQENGGADLIKAAELCVFLASSHSDGITGKLISAIWDDWQNFHEHRDDILNTDIFTLRRILPNERHMDWS